MEYSTDMDFFLGNQILCIVDKEGTKFCSLIENRLFMRSKNRRISKRMQEHIMREIHSDICRLWRGTGGLTCHPPHLTSDRIKKSGRPYGIARLFFYFCVVEYKNKKIIRLEDFET